MQEGKASRTSGCGILWCLQRKLCISLHVSKRREATPGSISCEASLELLPCARETKRTHLSSLPEGSHVHMSCLQCHWGGVQNPLTIPVYSHSLPRKVPHIFRGVGFGFHGCICVDFLFRGASATVLFTLKFITLFFTCPFELGQEYRTRLV